MSDVTSSGETQPRHTFVVNIDENAKSGLDGTIDFSKLFNLQRIKIEYIAIKTGQTKAFVVYPKTYQFAYIIKGEGSLRVDGVEHEGGVNVETNGRGLKKDDCFSFPPLGEKTIYYINATSDETGIITFADREGSERTVVNVPQVVRLPVIHAAHSLNYSWSRSGIDLKKRTSLSGQTDMSLAAPTSSADISSFMTPTHLTFLSALGFAPEKVSKQFFLPWNVNLCEFLPGAHSSNSHCHSREDEFSIVLAGKGRYWCQGEEPEKIVKAGDCIGWRAGTGVCHSILNDADGPNGEGETCIMLTWGENNPTNDKIHYATSHPSWWADSIRWFDRPELPIGNAPPRPHYPRSD